MPDSWGNLESVGAYYRSGYVHDGYGGVFGNQYDADNSTIDSEKDNNNITKIPESLGKITYFGKYTFYTARLNRGTVITVPDTPLEKPNSDLKHPTNRLELAVLMFSSIDYGREGYPPNATYAGLYGPIYLRPESGKNPDNIKATLMM